MELKEKYIIILSAFVLIITSYFSLGHYHPDEHYQILEFAGVKLNLTPSEDMPWEFHNKMRPAFQPAIAVLTHKFLALFKLDNPFIVTFALRLLSAILSFITTYQLYQLLKNKIEDKTLKEWFLYLSFFLWFFIFNAVRFSSETWSGFLFILGFIVYFKSKKDSFWNYLLIGGLFGLSFLCRFQTAFLTLGFMSWLLFVEKRKVANLIFISIGVLTLIGLGILIDSWYYNEWTLTTWNYFEQNLILNKASEYGIEPWYYYFSDSFLNAIPPFSLLIITGYLVFLIYNRKNPILWSITPFIIIHSLIGHKELRFMFPLIPFIPFIMIKGIEIIQNKLTLQLSTNRVFKFFISLFIIINSVLVIVISFRTAYVDNGLFKTVYNYSEEPITLYTLDRDPYSPGHLRIHYLKPKNLTIKKISSLEEIPVKENHIFMTDKRIDDIGTILYSSIPQWVLNIKFNDWQKRTRKIFVYKPN